MKKVLLLILLFNAFTLRAQEEDRSDLDAYLALQAGYSKTGMEFFLYYPIGLHFPGWSYPSIDHDAGDLRYETAGPNISLLGLGGGLEIDFGGRGPVLGRMGIGGALEFSLLAPANMIEGTDVGLLINYAYLYYKTRREEKINYTFRMGLGVVRVMNGEMLFAYPEEKENPVGPQFSLEGAMIFKPRGRFRFQAGLAYRYIPINTKNIHIISPMIRGGFRI